MTSIRQCKVSLEGLSVEEVQMCLEVEASASVKATINTQAKHCKKNIDKTESQTSFSGLFNDRYRTFFFILSLFFSYFAHSNKLIYKKTTFCDRKGKIAKFLTAGLCTFLKTTLDNLTNTVSSPHP